jgi:histidinol phosphatase-like PHP family hydrolase
MKDDGLHVDWHCHSTWSDGQATVAELARMARRRGVALGISDHGLSDNRRLCSQDQVDDYLADLGRFPVLRGLEITVGDLGQPSRPPTPVAARRPARLQQPQQAGLPGIPGLPACDVNLDGLDYLIASLHNVYIPEGRVHATRYHNYRAGLYPGYKRSLERYPRRHFFEAWLRDLDATARHWPVTILGHFCLLPELARADMSYTLDEDPAPDKEAAEFLDATIRLCVQHDIAVEINTKSRVPHAFFVERALELGARFSLGSDAHRLQQCGHLSYSRQMVERFHIPLDRLLRPSDVRPDLGAEPQEAAG